MKSNSKIAMTPEEARSIRTDLGLTQAEFAVLLGITSRAVALRERGSKPINRQAALAIEFVLAAKTSSKIRKRLKNRIS